MEPAGDRLEVGKGAASGHSLSQRAAAPVALSKVSCSELEAFGPKMQGALSHGGLSRGSPSSPETF